MHPARLKEDGTLEETYKPALYLDTNFLWNYFNAEGSELFFDENGEDINPEKDNDDLDIPPSFEDRRYRIIRDLIKPKNEQREYGTIRHIASYGLSKASLVLTPIAWLELYKIHAEIMFKNNCAISLGAKPIQRMSEKDVGKYLSNLYNRFKVEEPENDDLKQLISACVFNMSFARGHGFQGAFYISNLNIQISESDVGSFLWVLGFLQFEAADIIHLHTAKKLGCEYFVSLDKAFSINRELINRVAGIKILCNPTEVLAVLRSNMKDRS
jgi:hypothetical protein